jgi:transcriptional regulator with XRE-family HTH domain
MPLSMHVHHPMSPDVSVGCLSVDGWTGADVQRARKRLGLSQDELASLAGVTRRTIGRLEHSEHDNPHSLGRVLRVLGLVDDDEPPLGRPGGLDQVSNAELVARLNIIVLEMTRRLDGHGEEPGRVGSMPPLDPPTDEPDRHNDLGPAG